MGGIDVIIPAGGRLPKHFADVVGTDCKPLIRFAGVSTIYRIIQAFRATEGIGKIVVVGAREVINHPDCAGAHIRLPERESGPANIYAGLAAVSEGGVDPERVLICTADLPFLTPDGIRSLLDRSGDKDFYAGLISRAEWEDAYPMCDATFVHLLDGDYTLGCLYNVRVVAMKRALAHIESVFKNRKSKLGMARLLGLKFVWKYLTRSLTVEMIVARAQHVLGSSVEPVRGVAPELSFDIDALEDYHYALQNVSNCLAGKWMPPKP